MVAGAAQNSRSRAMAQGKPLSEPPALSRDGRCKATFQFDRTGAVIRIRVLRRQPKHTEIESEKRNYPMRYTQPKITKTFVATSTIKSMKGGLEKEAITHVPTTGPAYQADE